MEEQTVKLSNNESVSEKKPNNSLIVGILILAAIFIVPMLFTKSKTNSQTPTNTETNMESAKEAITKAPEISPSQTPVDVTDGKIAIEAGSFYYKPNLIRVKKGEKVKITLNSVSMMHDLVIDELGLKIPVTKSGNTAVAEFTPEKAGEFEFYCSVGQHRQNGQVGKLIVTE